jgi:hypothetical protein
LFLLNVVPSRVSCFTHWTAILPSSTKIIRAPVSHMCSTKQQQCKRADVVDVCTKRRVANEFLNAEGSSLIQIYRRRRSVYGEDAIHVSSDAGSVILTLSLPSI